MKEFDLEKRTFNFALEVRLFTKKLPRSIASIEDIKQLIRSSGSVGANYIEANEALSKKDFLMRIKICRKESKESIYWLNLLEVTEGHIKERDGLAKEGIELLKIFSSIISKNS